ncbi:hypothetical protein BDZ85DRAFT_260975 [Elsinoe ampelina]|uniref:Uncharacterized protein n=1 Tax=Elsinoe ampelina TaxID=302913 RepID=A0A6A6GG04_9PEZI|nr:hypothetical protein BDZ85DRAFT_260975 [Elsinoe ampelina]
MEVTSWVIDCHPHFCLCSGHGNVARETSATSIESSYRKIVNSMFSQLLTSWKPWEAELGRDRLDIAFVRLCTLQMHHIQRVWSATNIRPRRSSAFASTLACTFMANLRQPLPPLPRVPQPVESETERMTNSCSDPKATCGTYLPLDALGVMKAVQLAECCNVRPMGMFERADARLDK